jgi:hypothetical protein
VYVNEFELIADAQGNFVQSMRLDEGENIIIVFANDADGNAAEEQLTITFVPQE